MRLLLTALTLAVISGLACGRPEAAVSCPNRARAALWSTTFSALDPPVAMTGGFGLTSDQNYDEAHCASWSTPAGEVRMVEPIAIDSRRGAVSFLLRNGPCAGCALGLRLSFDAGASFAPLAVDLPSLSVDRGWGPPIYVEAPFDVPAGATQVSVALGVDGACTGTLTLDELTLWALDLCEPERCRGGWRRRIYENDFSGEAQPSVTGGWFLTEGTADGDLYLTDIPGALRFPDPIVLASGRGSVGFRLISNTVDQGRLAVAVSVDGGVNFAEVVAAMPDIVVNHTEPVAAEVPVSLAAPGDAFAFEIRAIDLTAPGGSVSVLDVWVDEVTACAD